MLIAVFVLAGLVIASIGCSSESSGGILKPEGRLRVATTTSLYDTGLWGYLEPEFEKQYDVELDVLSGGSGLALEWGRRGDVDVLTVHSKADELKFIEDGYATERVWFAYNYFLIVGPEDDPADIKDMSPEEAFKVLYEGGEGKFVSRGDNSGTHSKEKAIWKAAGYADYAALVEAGIAAGWYLETGSGMGATLQLASEMGAYTLTDIGTFLAYKSDLQLVPVVESGSILLNVYSVLVCAKSKKQEMANNMVAFLTSPDVQEMIGDYGKADYDQSLFTPCAGQDEPTS